MTDWIQVVVLAIIQGLTEFLPISSSAHLILVPQLTGWADQGLSFDVSVHFGTLLAVVLYFKDELKLMIQDSIKTLKGQGFTVHSHLSLQIVLATIPVCVVGFLFHDLIAQFARNPFVIATTTIIFGIMLWASEKFSKQEATTVTYKQAIIVGLGQVLALIPGTSRSGITLTTALSLGLNRQTAARFAFLLAIPVILAAMSYETLKLASSGIDTPWSSLLLGIVLSFGFAYGCIHFFLKLFEKMGLLPFVLYRLALGVFLLFFFS